MINLLNGESLKKSRSEQLRKFVLMWGTGLFFLQIIHLIFLGPAFFYLYFEKKNSEQELNTAETSLKIKKTAELESFIGNFKTILKEYEINKTKQAAVYPYLNSILEQRSDDIFLNSFSFSAGDAKRITINGLALSRTAFLKFLEELHKTQKFEKVDSPLSNLLKDKNLEFHLTLFIK